MTRAGFWSGALTYGAGVTGTERGAGACGRGALGWLTGGAHVSVRGSARAAEARRTGLSAGKRAAGRGNLGRLGRARGGAGPKRSGVLLGRWVRLGWWTELDLLFPFLFSFLYLNFSNF